MSQIYKPFDWYKTPLYYDIIFDADTRKEARFVDALYRRHTAGGSKRILEPACGSGRLLVPLARQGYRVAGFDLSEPMLQFARERMKRNKVQAALSQQRMENFRYRHKFDLAFCFVSTFKYLLTEQAARMHLQCVADHLVRGGVYLLGFHLSDYDRQTRERERWVAGRGGTQVVCNIQSWPPDRRQRIERVRSRLVVHKRGAPTERYQTEWTFRTYDNRQFLNLLAKVPSLKIAATHDFYYEPKQSLDFHQENAGVIVVLQKQ